MLPNALLQASGISFRLSGTSPDGERDVTNIVYDSRKAAPGALFVCLVGANADGHLYAADAYRRGCRAFLAQRPPELPGGDAAVFLTDDTRRALALVSAAFFGWPARRLHLIGVTGTKGKTTVTNHIYSLLTRAGIQAGVIGTNGVRYGDVFEPTANTTPESCELHRIFAQMLEAGVTHVAMEVSSQALYLGRVYGLRFDIAVFTNLSPDHIGPTEHPTLAHYFACKKQLFLQADFGICNADDPHITELMRDAPCPIERFGIDTPCEWRAADPAPRRLRGALGMAFTCVGEGTRTKLTVSTPGRFSVYNALTVIAVCRRCGVPMELIRTELPRLRVKGRFEFVEALPWCTIVIDYAHNGVSLENLLTSVRDYRPKRIVCLFGAVGERTRGRRREMGEVAARLADACILTSDNPGTEPPMDILAEIESCFAGSSCPCTVIADREEAVRYAVAHAQPGDLLLLCGKGHETYQLVGNEKRPLSERRIVLDEARRLLRKRAGPDASASAEPGLPRA